MKNVALTQDLINCLKFGTSWDSIALGLGVRVHKNTKSYVFRKKGENNPKTLGSVSLLNLQEARKHAVSLGASRNVNGLTFSDIAAEWGDNWGQFHRSRFKTEDLRRLNKYILPNIGDKLVKDIKGKDLIQLHSRISLKAKIEANRCISLISAIYNKALEWELIDGRNPALAVKKNSESGRDRVAEDNELKRLLCAIREHPFGTIFLLIIQTGMRKGEACRLEWVNVDLQNGLAILKNTKNGKDHAVSISEEVIRRLKLEKTDSKWVFPSSVTGSHIKDCRRHWRQIKYEAGITGLTLHDLRRTFTTRLIESGMPVSHVSKALNHSSTAITERHYNRLGQKTTKEVFKKAWEIF